MRRVHYSGKYPKKFEEKYKEHNPEKYKETIEHVIAKGSTPAGMHISICVNEILDVLDIKPGERGLDCTLGYGGHTEKMLEKLGGEGHLVSLDVDTEESAKTLKRLRDKGYDENIFDVLNINFADLDKAADKYGKFDFVLADLGVSSMQIDNPERGFSYKINGPLDLRLDRTKGVTAAERLKNMDADEIAGMLVENADEPYAEEIALAIVKARRIKPIETTTDLRRIIEDTLKFLPKDEYKDAAKKSCQRSFQALRIDINHEYEVLYSLLEKLPGVMNEGGRVAILTFHSGEDRQVKKSFKAFKKTGDYMEIAQEAIRPSSEERTSNPRSKCAKLRWAKK